MFSVFLQILKAGLGGLFLTQDKRPILFINHISTVAASSGYATCPEFCFSHCLISISSTSVVQVVVRVVCLWSSIIPPSIMYWLGTRCFSISNGRLKTRKHLLRNENALKPPSTTGNSLTHAQVKKVNVRKKLKKGNARTDIRVFLSTQKRRENSTHIFGPSTKTCTP